MARKRDTAEEISGKLREAAAALAQGDPVAKGARCDGADLLPLAAGVRRPARRSGEAAQGAGAGERPAQTAGRRPGPGQRHLEGSVLGKLLSPARRRQAVMHVRTVLPVSERRACRVLAQPRSTQRRPARVAADAPALIARLITLARRFGRYGSRRITALLRAEGWRVNHKRVERLWRQEGLRVPRKPRRRAERPHHVWSYACVRERTHDGRPLRVRTRSGRAHAGVPQHRWRAPPAVRRRPGAPHGALRAARPAQLPALGHRPRVHSDSGAVLAPPAGRHDPLHRTRPSLGERRRGSMQRHAPRRGPHPRDLHDPHRSPGPQRPLAARVHPGAPAQRPRLPAARPGRAGDRTAPPHALGSPEGSPTHLASGTTIGGRSQRVRAVRRGETALAQRVLRLHGDVTTRVLRVVEARELGDRLLIREASQVPLLQPIPESPGDLRLGRCGSRSCTRHRDAHPEGWASIPPPERGDLNRALTLR